MLWSDMADRLYWSGARSQFVRWSNSGPSRCSVASGPSPLAPVTRGNIRTCCPGQLNPSLPSHGSLNRKWPETSVHQTESPIFAPPAVDPRENYFIKHLPWKKNMRLFIKFNLFVLHFLHSPPPICTTMQWWPIGQSGSHLDKVLLTN